MALIRKGSEPETPATEKKLGRRAKDKADMRPAVEPHELISTGDVEQIRKSIIKTNADLVVQGMLDRNVREQLERVVRREFSHIVKGNADVISYVVSETIGTGVIEDILQDESITDVGYNGRELIIESNDNKQVFDTSFSVTEEYIQRVVNKFANANDTDFTPKNPVFDGRFENVRINAVHSQNTAPESGTTMSLRVVRPRLALTEANFEGFAPMFVLDFFRAAALTRSNMVISGTTGTGKTELHKLISSYIPFDDRILLIEDTPETFMKEMFPEKDVYSWVTGQGVSVTELIKAGLRNNPAWIMVTETRGMEAYEMIQAVLSGHSIITSLHATSAEAIPTRFVNMAKMGYELSEEALVDDINRYFHFGIHIRKAKYNGMVIRYLSEIVAFDINGSKSVFKQRFVDGVFRFETFELPDEFYEMAEEVMVDVDWPAGFKSERPLDPSDTTFEASIPLRADGRPDIEAIKASGQTLESLMLRDADSGDDDTVYEDVSDLDVVASNDPIYEIDDDEVAIEDAPGPDARVAELKKIIPKPPVIKKRERTPKKGIGGDELSDIEADLSKIMASVQGAGDSEDAPKKRPPMPPGRRERKVDIPSAGAIARAREKMAPEAPKTPTEILADKRRELDGRDV